VRPPRWRPLAAIGVGSIPVRAAVPRLGRPALGRRFTPFTPFTPF
jgi:hypothetical protein